MSTTVKHNADSIGVIDIFAGPGGLGEGFSSFESGRRRGSSPFQLVVSAEMEKSAHATLRLRAFYRLLRQREGDGPSAYLSYLEDVVAGRACKPEEHFGTGSLRGLWQEADGEALNLTMGDPEHNRRLFERIKAVQSKYERLILIGGPPCQAYSLVGRARQKNVKGFRANGDVRHFLYKQYLGILAEFAPDIFIMENVKGILTSKVGNQDMFSSIQRDLANPAQALGIASRRDNGASRYVLLPIHVDENRLRRADSVALDPSGFLIRCENHGVPQARHRVIIMGVRADCLSTAVERLHGLHLPDRLMHIEDALAGLPKLRSGLSRQADDSMKWRKAIDAERKRVVMALGRSNPETRQYLEEMRPAQGLPRSSIRYAAAPTGLSEMLRSSSQSVVLNHETRGHMESDLGRYMFCAAFAKANGRSPTSSEFPKKLAPAHLNWESGVFADRFRVQVEGRPSSTVTSHLSKDGHAFIHWDPAQCRSLTVREAARLQTFPDDYLFLGNRTQQFVQVGNAVPPMIARQIAEIVYKIIRSSQTNESRK